MVTFYYYTFFCLPRTINVIILGEDPKICEQYLNLVTHLPVSFNLRIRSYPTKYVGVYSQIYLPHGSRVPYLFRDFFRNNSDVITGFCAETANVSIPKQRLSTYWDESKKRGKWREIDEKWDKHIDPIDI